MNEPLKLPLRPLINPLTPDDEVAINQVLAKLPHIEDLLHRAEACGLDVSDRKAKHEMHKAIAQRLKQHFFPNELPAISE